MNVPEPVRKYLYSVAGALLIALVAWGIIDDNSALVIAGLLQAILVIPTEAARSKVRPITRHAPDDSNRPQAL